MPKIRVLILDDSLVFREFLTRGLEIDPQVEVVAKAENPYDAVEKIEKFNPDVITCDVNMPKMDGIEFIRQLMPQHPVPVIVVSSVRDTVFDAMNAGAVGFVAKPDLRYAKGVEEFLRDLIDKVKEASKSKVIQVKSQENVQKKQVDLSHAKRIIAIGASTGGTEAIFQVLKGLPSQIPGIVIVQHIPPQFSKMFAERLNNQLPFEVLEASGGEKVIPGRVLIAPGDKHMAVVKLGDQLKVEVFKGDKVNGHCPSVDVLFESVAKAVPNASVGVLLTGMGYDGAKGLLSMRRKGGRTLGQDESSSVVYGMPKAAYEVGGVELQYSLLKMADGICKALKS